MYTTSSMKQRLCIMNTTVLQWDRCTVLNSIKGVTTQLTVLSPTGKSRKIYLHDDVMFPAKYVGRQFPTKG